MAKKRCGKCGRRLLLEAFHHNRTKPGGRQSMCARCQNQSVDNARARVKRIVFEEKARRNFRCEDCKKKFNTWQLDFDHKEGTEKRFNLGDVTSCVPNAEKLYAEIAKCALVCANCHRDRTHNRLEQRARAA